jgi:hypothetical protein
MVFWRLFENVIAEAGDIDDAISRILQEKDDEGRLPIHVACLNKVSADVVRFLASKNPKAFAPKTIMDRICFILPFAIMHQLV